MDYMMDAGSMAGTDTALGLLAGFGVVGSLISMAVCAVLIVSLWMVFTKAGEAGWKCLIPFYNVYILFKIAGCGLLWFILSFIPVANVVATLVCYYNLSKAFGKGALFMICMLFFPYVCFPILAFGKSQYVGVAQ